MKKTLRRLSAAVVAAAMIFSLLPYLGKTVRADNKPLVPGTYIAAGHGYRPGNGTSSNEYLPMEGESKDWFKASGDLSECISYYQTPGADSANNSWHTSANDSFYLFYITHEKWSWASGWAYGSGFNDVERGYYVDAPGGGGEYQLYFASFDNDHIILSFPMEDRGAPYGVKVLEGDGTLADPARFALVFSEPHVIGLTASAGGSAVVDVEGEGSNASAADNEKVYVRLTPDEGYAVSSVTYTPSGGSPVALTKEDNNLYSFTMPATAVTVNASFTAGHTVRFVNNNGTDDTVWHITDGETLTVPADPAASGKLFAGWYTDSQFEPSSFVDVKNNAPAVTSDMVLYARYADDLAPVWDGKTISWTPRDPSVDPGHIEINLYALYNGEFYRFYTIDDVDESSSSCDLSYHVNNFTHGCLGECTYRISVNTVLDDDPSHGVESFSGDKTFYEITYDYMDNDDQWDRTMSYTVLESQDTYGKYDAIPTPGPYQGVAFNGWFSEPDGEGYQITSRKMFFSGDPQTVYAYYTDSHSHDSMEFEEWDTSSESSPLPNRAGCFYLTDDVEINSTWIPVDGTTLCLNGHSITYKGNSASEVIRVGNGVTLNLYDCRGKGTISGGVTGGIILKDGGKLFATGISVCNNLGSGMILEGSSSELKFKNGTISGNTAEAGAGIANYGGTVYIEDSVIKDNYASGRGGGILEFAGTLALQMNTEITGNDALSGGGIYVASGTADMSGKIVVDGNYADGRVSNIYLAGSSTTRALYLEDGSSVGVSMENPGMFGTNYLTDNRPFYFSDSKMYQTELRNVDLYLVRDTSYNEATGIKLSQTASTIFSGESMRLIATMTPSNATENIIWASSDENVATVDDSGNVTAVGKGTALITATTEDTVHRATCEVTVKDPAPEFVGCTLLLRGQLTMQFIFDIPASLTEGSFVEFDVCGKKTTVTFDEATPGNDGSYRFLRDITAVEMADTITADLHYFENGTEKIVKGETTVEDYLAYIVENGDDPLYSDAVDIAKAINDYGYYSQPVADTEAKHVRMTKAFSPEDYFITSIDGYAVSFTRGEHTTAASYSLSLTAETKINLFFVTDGMEINVDNITVTSSGNTTFEYSAEKVGRRYRVQITGLNAAELGDTFTVTLEDGSMVTCSALSYVQTTLMTSKTATAASKLAAASFYNYYVEACRYLGI